MLHKFSAVIATVYDYYIVYHLNTLPSTTFSREKEGPDYFFALCVE